MRAWPPSRSYERATNALRVLPQLTATDLQVCAAFQLDPFAYLSAKLNESDALVAERQARADRVARNETYRRDMDDWGRAELERMRDR